jgi:inosine/xanthosine triphosphatase
MLKVLITSKNPVKIKATKQAFSQAFSSQKIKIISKSVSSGVPNQPFGDAEIYKGALNRAKRAKLADNSYDFYVGIEGGVKFNKKELECFAWIVILGKNKITRAKTASFFLPKEIADLLKTGLELGEATDQVFGGSTSLSVYNLR